MDRWQLKNTIGQSKLWVYSTAFIMSFNGGYINSFSLVSILKNSVGYVTGNLTISAEYLEKGDYHNFIYLFILVFCFLLGSVLSGLIVKNQNFKIDRRYDTSLLAQSVLVIASLFLLLNGYHQSSYLLALTMGMQNAMTTHYSSALIRTTHMTGTMTDLGVLISHWIRGREVHFWKIRLYLLLILGFSTGTIL
ncbi:MAG: DUF1275 domain-containing protein, partial [Coxiellaceae bacterium]|nr:DUF1275 domain-containing protein [Coxiellaceae bacterium]